MRTIVIAAVAVAAVGLSGCGQDQAQAKKDCLYAVVQAYPTWGVKTSITESLPECKKLPEAERAQIRTQLDAVVTQALANAKK